MIKKDNKYGKLTVEQEGFLNITSRYNKKNQSFDSQPSIETVMNWLKSSEPFRYAFLDLIGFLFFNNEKE